MCGERNDGVEVGKEGRKAMVTEPRDKGPSSGLSMRYVMSPWASDLPSRVHDAHLRNVENSPD